MRDTAEGSSHEIYVARMQGLLLDTTRRVLDGAREWDLVDFPHHLNCGDSAIWLGEQKLGRTLGVATRSVTTPVRYDKAHLRADGPIVIHGGGNFGGLYPVNHVFRLKLLQENRSRPIIQMPQSVEFTSHGNIDDLKRAIEDHGRFTLLVRDQRSFERSSPQLPCPVILAPDAAFALGAIPRGAPNKNLALQARADSEKGPTSVPSEWETFDWVQGGEEDPRRHADRLMRNALRVSRRRVPGRIAALRVVANNFARSNTKYALEKLSMGAFVISDRLHGHILTELMGIPHIAVNDRYGKIASFFETWSSESGTVVSTWTEAIEEYERRSSQVSSPPVEQ